MKKSPLFLSIVFLFLIMPLFAQMQSFEIYPFGGHSEPDITDISVIKVSSSLVKVTATITDISGVLSTGAIVKDSSGVERERGIMYDDGSHEDGSARDHIYSALFSIDSYPEGTFSVDLFAVDIFGNRADLTNVGEFLITPAATTETIELWTDKVESIWGYADHLNYKCLNYQDPYNTCFDDSRAQFIIPASELTNRGFKYGDKITSIYLKTSELPKLNLKNFRIRMKQIGSQIETASWEGGWTDLFGPTDILTTELAVDDWKEYTFSVTPAFEWDGTSNIMVDISRDDTYPGFGGGMYKRENIGAQRMFAGVCNVCTIYSNSSGATGGAVYDFCPSIKLTHTSTVIPGGVTEVGSFIVVPTEVTSANIVNLSATLTYSNGTPIANEIILFRDETADINIGSVVTNGAGIAQINYPIILAATIGSHTLKAIYAGNAIGPLLSSEKTAAINITVSTIATVELWTSNPESAWDWGDDPYHHYYYDSRAQFIILSSDLPADLSRIASVYLKTSELPKLNLKNFRIRMKQIGSQIETASWEGGWTDLFGPTDILTTELAVDDWKEYTFSVTPAFEWDGTSNIMVDISRDDDTDFSPWGAIYKRGNVGTNRMFAGACSNCTFDDLSLYQQIYGNLGSGLSYNYCPSIKLSYIPGNATEIDPFTAVPAEVTIGSTVNLSATLTYSNGTQIANEIILFRDEFDEDIGSVITNGSGVAQINYLVPSIFGATTLTFKAIYVGNTARNLLSSEKTVTINFIASP